MVSNQRDNKTFEAKVSNLIAATKHLNASQILLLRRLTMSDPESRKWASERQLTVVFNVILAKYFERTGSDKLREARDKNFDPLLPPGPNQDDDRAIIASIAEDMLGPDPRHALLEHEQALARLFNLGIQRIPGRTSRQPSKYKEPPPLFAAQLGPGMEKIGGTTAGASRSRLLEPEVMAAMQEEKPFTDFNTLFDDTICAHAQRLLTLFQIKRDLRADRPPFPLAPEFSPCYESVLRRMVLPNMRVSRHIQQLSHNHNWAEVGGRPILAILQGGEHNNPVLHNWDTRWSAFRTTKGKKPKPEDDPWPIFRKDATVADYEPPNEGDLKVLQQLIRFEADSIAKAWREIQQLYEQEFSPSGRQEQAREGAFRDGLMRWSSKLPDHVGEFLSMKAYYTFDRVDATFMRKLITNFGRSDSERRRNAPYLSDFIMNLRD